MKSGDLLNCVEPVDQRLPMNIQYLGRADQGAVGTQKNLESTEQCAAAASIVLD